MLYLFDAYKCYLYPTSAEVRTYLRHIPWEWQEQTVTWAKICISCVTDFYWYTQMQYEYEDNNTHKISIS